MTLEWVRLRRSPAALAVLAFALLASLYAVWSGHQWSQAYLGVHQQYQDRMVEDMAEWRAALVAIEAGEDEASPYDARPMDISQPATHALGGLGHLAIGYRDVTPSRLSVSTWRNEISMVERYEFDNPMTLALGTFDFSFFLVVVLPVLMIALSFDVIASDRATGRHRLLLSNPLSTRQVILARLLLRNGVLCGLVLLAMLVGFLVSTGAQALDYALWLGICLAYMAFWLGLIFLVVSRLQRSESVATGLVAGWILLTFALPALVDTSVEALYPPPSKLAYLSVARLAQGEANKQTAELTEGFLADHPELSVGDEAVPGYYRGTFLANERVRRETAPVVADFRQSAARREALVGVFQYLSPAVLTQRALYEVAQSDMASSRRFQQAAGAKLAELEADIRSAVISRNRISLDEYDAITAFQLPKRSWSTGLPLGISVMICLAAALTWLGWRGAR